LLGRVEATAPDRWEARDMDLPGPAVHAAALDQVRDEGAARGAAVTAPLARAGGTQWPLLPDDVQAATSPLSRTARRRRRPAQGAAGRKPRPAQPAPTCR